jgi:hypothetical protein
MKKMMFMVLTIILAAASLAAQDIPGDWTPEQLEAAKAAYSAGKSPEEIQAAIDAAAPKPAAAPNAGPEAAAASAAPAAKPNVTTPLGELSIDGRVIVGLQADWIDQYGETFSDFGAINAQMGENRAELSFHLKNGNFGEFIMLRAQQYSPNVGYKDGNYNPENNTLNVKIDEGTNKGSGFAATIPYFFVYGNFFDNLLKISVGKLYDENYVTRERIWKTEGATEGGFYFSREGYMSMRFQFFPIKGLDVGAQLFFTNTNARYVMNLMGIVHDDPLPINASMEESLKEWGLGASYTSSLFNAQAGVRLDSGVDPMNKYEARTYLYEYYGEHTYMDPYTAMGYNEHNPVAPNYKHWDKLRDMKVTFIGEPGNMADLMDPTKYTASFSPKPFSDGMYAFAGFNLKLIKNLTLKVQTKFNNIPAFNEFGYGIVDETIGYQVLPKLYTGVVMYQEFYGSDVFDDTKYANSPYFRFTPQVSYQITPAIKATLEGTVGLCKDVLETPHMQIKPILDITLAAFGAMRANIYYAYEKTNYKDYKGIDYDDLDFSAHSIGLGLDFIF